MPPSLLILFPLLMLVPLSSASCFGRDAHFKKLVPPVIVQPTRGDPTKILVSWDTAIERPQCVDRYYVRVWAQGTNMTQGAKHIVTEKDPAKKQVVLTKTVSVQPCVNYRIAVELEELDKVSGSDLEKTAEATFRSQGTSTVAAGNTATMVKATYLWDPVRKSVDLSKAVLSIPKEAVTNPDCLDYVQVTAAEVLGSPPLSSRSSAHRGVSGNHLLTGCQQESVNYQNRVRAEVLNDILSAADCSLRCSAKPSCKAWTWNRGSAPREYRHKCALMEGYSNTAPDSNTISGARDCQPSPHVSSSPSGPQSPSPPRGGSSRISYSSVAGGSSPSGSSPSSPRVTFPKPAFAYLLPRTKKGAARMVGPLKLPPPYPFMSPTIDFVVPIEDCAGYMFHVQFHAGRKKLGEIPSIPLPALADFPSYVPPPVTSVVGVAYSPSGTPVYTLKPESGVTPGCLPAYFEAYDSYAQRLDNEVSWVGQERDRVRGLIVSSGSNLETSQEELLKVYGCSCTSPHVELSTTDPQVLKKTEANQLGQYRFGGIHDDHPFYVHAPASSSSGGNSPPLSASSTPAPSNPLTEPMYLFFNKAKQQWLVGKTLGTTSGLFFGTKEKSQAKCPGDSGTRGNWQTATATFGRWKANPQVSVACQTKV